MAKGRGQQARLRRRKSPRRVAALYVETGGHYFGLDDVDPWDEERNALLYLGPYPVVTHPPCQRWGHFWFGSTSPNYKGPRYEKPGMDNGLFKAALAQVRYYGGVLEHPAQSRAWKHFGLNTPPKAGGWVRADNCGGWTATVYQGHYGHRAPKATWLYAVGIDPLPELIWGPSQKQGRVQNMCRRERRQTPIPFRDLLLDMARSVDQSTLPARTGVKKCYA